CGPTEFISLDTSARAFWLALVALEVIVKNFKINQYWVRCIPGGDRRRDRRWASRSPFPSSMSIQLPQIQLQFHSCNWDPIPQFQFRIGTHTAISLPPLGPQ